MSARRHHVRFGGVTDERWERDNAERNIQQLSVRTPSADQLNVNLSGGNQQKVILGRWLSENVKVILLDEPTLGIDVGARSEIYRIIYDLAVRGIGVVVVSSDLPEVIGILDRVLVMRQGRVAGEMPRDSADPETILKLALPVGV